MSTLERTRVQQDCQEMLCPACQIPLKVGLKGSGEADFCEKCQGLWVDITEERHVLDLKPQVFTVDELKNLSRVYQLPAVGIKPVRYLPCPVCQQMMYRRNWGGHSGVLVEKCKAHGTWFTPGQIEKIKEYINLGGIEFEKLQMTETGLSKVNNRLNVLVESLRKGNMNAK